jgi:hypothetical protein
MKPINLGKSNSGPCGPVSTSESNAKPSYPSLYFTLPSGEAKIPECGTMTISFSRKEKTIRKTESVEECSYVLDMKEITSISEDKGVCAPARSFDSETKEALKKLRAKKPEGEVEGDDEYED